MTRACSLCSSPNPPESLFCAACGAALEAPPTEDTGAPVADGFAPLPSGTLVRDGTLVLVQVLGQGGFGITYLAREFSSGRSVAVKELFPFGCVRQNGSVAPSTLLDADAWQAAREGFRREAALLTGHAHPHVVQVLDVWDERGTAFLAMEFLDGQTLAQVLEAKGTLGVRRVRAMIEQVGGALGLLHQAGMLHRDIKPENIMLCRSARAVAPSTSPGATLSTATTDRWVLLDFGAARAFAAGRSVSLTQIVTPGYAPLEQYASRARGGPPSDIYALAATAYHALTGLAPPAATERAGQDDLIPPHALNPNVPQALSQAIVRALSLRVDGRPATVEAWLRELDGIPTVAAEPMKSPFAPPIPLPPPVAAPRSLQPPAPLSERGFQDRFGGAMEIFERAAASRPASSGASSTYPLGPEASGLGPMGQAEHSAQAAARAIAPIPPLLDVRHLLSEPSYRVSVSSRRIVWPKKCACCGGGMVLPLDVRTPTIWWQLPYCAACREHAERGESISDGGGVAAALFFALGVSLLLLEGIRPGLALCGLALAIRFATGMLPSWLWALRRAAQSSSCCSYVPAGRFRKKEGDTYVWEFRSRSFAEEFWALNGGEVALPGPPAKPPVARASPAEHQRISN